MLLVVVAIHELGHFVVAKRAGIMVQEFSIGFGPRLFSRIRGETRYSLRLLPLGGYVRLAGMTGLEKPPDDGGARGFIHASNVRKALTLAAGGLMNMVLAGAIFTGVAVVGGPSPQIEHGERWPRLVCTASGRSSPLPVIPPRPSTGSAPTSRPIAAVRFRSGCNLGPAAAPGR